MTTLRKSHSKNGLFGIEASPSQKIILAADTFIPALLLQVNENIINDAQQKILVYVIPTANHLIRHTSPRQ
ncbi:hypothetical protein ACUX20_23005 [Salmonella enterica]